jgi:hypothetical protein
MPGQWPPMMWLCVAAIPLAGCPHHYEPPPHIPLPLDGDASMPLLDALGSFFDSDASDAGDAAVGADVAATSHDLTVQVLHDGMFVANADVYFHNATGALLAHVATGIDGAARTNDSAVNAATVVWNYPIVFGTASETHYEIATWFDFVGGSPRILKVDTGAPPGPKRQPTLVRLHLPGDVTGAVEYVVVSCFTSQSVQSTANLVSTSYPLCADRGPAPFVAMAKGSNGAIVAYSGITLAPQDPSTTEIDLSFPAWQTTQRTVHFEFQDLDRAPYGASYQLALRTISSSPTFIVDLGTRTNVAPAFDVSVPDLSSVGVALAIEVVSVGVNVDAGVPPPNAGQAFQFVDFLDPEASTKTYHLSTDVVAEPGGLALDITTPQRPSLMVMSPPAILQADVLAGGITYEGAGMPTPEGASYTWTAFGAPAVSKIFRMPELSGAVADLIGRVSPSRRSAVAIDSDSLSGYSDLLGLDVYQAVTRDGEIPFKSHLSIAIGQVNSR